MPMTYTIAPFGSVTVLATSLNFRPNPRRASISLNPSFQTAFLALSSVMPRNM